MSEVTKPILLDSTGQQLLQQLQAIAQAQDAFVSTRISISPTPIEDGTLICSILLGNNTYGIYCPSADTTLSATSENPVSNKAVCQEFNELNEEITTIKQTLGDLDNIVDGINRKVV